MPRVESLGKPFEAVERGGRDRSCRMFAVTVASAPVMATSLVSARKRRLFNNQDATVAT